MTRRTTSPRLHAGRVLVLGLAATIGAAGCRPRLEAPKAAASPAAEKTAGPNGGVVVEVGPRALAEVVCDADATLDVYFFDGDLQTPAATGAATFEAFGAVENRSLLPTRLTFIRTDDEAGNRFQTRAPDEWSGRRAAVVVPKVVIAGTRRHLDFEVDVPPTAGRTAPPSPATDGVEDPADGVGAAGLE